MGSAAAQTRKGDRPSELVWEKIATHWQQQLAHNQKVLGYIRGRGLWNPEILKALKVGYASGRLKEILPRDPKLVGQLKGVGVLNEKGNEFFFKRLVVPLFDSTGGLVNVYGRAVDLTTEVPHLYLPGPRRGVFNRTGVQDAPVVLLTESILDALSLMVLGFSNATASFGVTGFTADHKVLLQQAKTQRVYCVYDADPAGDHGADQLAHDLAVLGMECFRVRLPAKDPNDFLKAGGTKEQFQLLLDSARPITTSRSDSPRALPATIPSASSPSSATTITFGERTYQVDLLSRPDGGVLRVKLQVAHGGKTFLNTLNLFSDPARAAAGRRILEVFGKTTTKEQVDNDLLGLITALQAKGQEKSPAVAGDMTEAERHAALSFLRSPHLADLVRKHLTDMGVIGEDQSKLLVYLVALSRRLPRPLSLAVISRSSAGKSFLVARTIELVPQSDRLVYTRVSGKALYHAETDRLVHKLLAIEEVHGMEEASYALRIMQSNQMLTTLTTTTDPMTGEHKAQETVVRGPVALIVTTTLELDFETVSRAFVISVDESVAQTERIHHMQRQARTLAGLSHQLERQSVVTVHHNAQRLLLPLRVVNDLAPLLTFPTGTLRLRREHEKYLTLIEAITYLFQYQRVQGVCEYDGQSVAYVQTDPADVDLANELMVSSLRQAFEEVTTPSRELLWLIRQLVEARSGTGECPDEVRFSRLELREFSKWSDYQVRIHLKQLEEMEYVRAVTGSFGKQYLYALAPDHRLAIGKKNTLAEEIRELGLTSSADLQKKRP